MFHGHIGGLGPGTRYGLRADGPHDPARGHRFDPRKLLCDPFATRVDRPFRLHPSLFPGQAADSAAAMPKAIIEAPDPPAAPPRPRFAWDRATIYELAVRGFTMRHPAIPPALRGTFAGLGHPASVGYLRRRMVIVGWTPRGDARHVFTMRKANDREKEKYGAEIEARR